MPYQQTTRKTCQRTTDQPLFVAATTQVENTFCEVQGGFDFGARHGRTTEVIKSFLLTYLVDAAAVMAARPVSQMTTSPVGQMSAGPVGQMSRNVMCPNCIPVSDEKCYVSKPYTSF